MALSELVTMDTGELEVRLVESRKELFNLRFQLATGQLDNSSRIGHVKKDVARILTLLRQRDVELDEAEYAHAVAAEHEIGLAAAQERSAAKAQAAASTADEDETEEEA